MKEHEREVCVESIKGRLPFRLGTTSYIIPENIIPNVEYLCDQVDDIELVLFESDEFSNIPTQKEVEFLAEIASHRRLTYTVHLPLDTQLGCENEPIRIQSVKKCQRVMERMAPLDPFGWVLHLHGDKRGNPPTDDIDRWHEQSKRSIINLLESGYSSRTICVENLDYSYDLIEDLIEEYDLSVCVDIGHLLLTGNNVEKHLNRWKDRSRIIHLHGVKDGIKDHTDITHLPDGLLQSLGSWLVSLDSEEQRVVTLEIFYEEDFMGSIREVEKGMRQWLKPL